MVPKSCRAFGQDHAAKQVIRAKWRFDPHFALMDAAGGTQRRQAAFFTMLVKPSLIGSAVWVASFWASVASSLACAVACSICLRVCEGEISTICAKLFAPSNSAAKSNAALLLLRVISRILSP